MLPGTLSLDKAVMATRAAQGLLTSSNTKLVVDGHWGSFTDGSYAKAPSSLQQAVQGITQSFGPAYTPGNLREFFSQDKASIPLARSAGVTGNLVTKDKARALIERAYNLLNAGSVGIKLDDLQGFASLEAARKKVDGITYYDAAAVNSSGYTGLYQFGSKTWDDVKKRSQQAGNLLGTFSGSAKDPWLNTVAMVAYAMLNAAALRSAGYKGNIDARALYGSHQQGVGGYLSFTRTGQLMFPNQSSASIAFLKGGSLPVYA